MQAVAAPCRGEACRGDERAHARIGQAFVPQAAQRPLRGAGQIADVGLAPSAEVPAAPVAAASVEQAAGIVEDPASHRSPVAGVEGEPAEPAGSPAVADAAEKEQACPTVLRRVPPVRHAGRRVADGLGVAHGLGLDAAQRRIGLPAPGPMRMPGLAPQNFVAGRMLPVRRLPPAAQPGPVVDAGSTDLSRQRTVQGWIGSRLPCDV